MNANELFDSASDVEVRVCCNVTDQIYNERAITRKKFVDAITPTLEMLHALKVQNATYKSEAVDNVFLRRRIEVLKYASEFQRNLLIGIAKSWKGNEGVNYETTTTENIAKLVYESIEGMRERLNEQNLVIEHFKEVDGSLMGLSEENAILTSKIAQRNHRISVIKKTVREYVYSLGTLGRVIVEKCEELARLTTSRDNLADEVHRCHVEIERLTDELKLRVDYAAECRELQAKVNGMESDAKRIASDYAYLGNHVADMNVTIDSLKEQIELGAFRDSAEYGDMLTENTRLTAEVERLKAENADYSKRIMYLAKNTKHKCDSCRFEFPTCDSTEVGCVTFGIDDNPNAKGADADVVLRCKTYQPLINIPAPSHPDIDEGETCYFWRTNDESEGLSDYFTSCGKVYSCDIILRQICPKCGKRFKVKRTPTDTVKG